MSSPIPAQSLGIGDQETAQRIRELTNAVSLANATALKAHDRIDQFQPCPELPGFTTLEASKTEPTIRVRLQHSHSLKEGWRLSESTVEWTGEGSPDWNAIERELSHCHYYGVAEADQRNQPTATTEKASNE